MKDDDHFQTETYNTEFRVLVRSMCTYLLPTSKEQISDNVKVFKIRGKMKSCLAPKSKMTGDD